MPSNKPSNRRRNRPDKDGKDKTLFMNYRRRLRSQCGPDGFVMCSICGLPINLSKYYPDPWSLTIDHIVPIEKGGRTEDTNLQPAHMKCNRRKGTHYGITIEEVNKLREEQGAPPINSIKSMSLGYLATIPPAQRNKDDLRRAQEGLPQSVNWRNY